MTICRIDDTPGNAGSHGLTSWIVSIGFFKPIGFLFGPGKGCPIATNVVLVIGVVGLVDVRIYQYTPTCDGIASALK